jgi:K(+)-stimulated pyrophosphate-energized sodium pump
VTECCTDDKEKDACCETEESSKKSDNKAHAAVIESVNKCDMSECSKMSKDECAAMCADKGCSKEETADCLSKYDDEGKWIGTKKD